MPLIRAEDLGEDLEDKPVKEGKYPLRIIKSKYGQTKKGDHNMLTATIRVEGPDGEGAALINHYLLEPSDEDDGAARRNRLRDIKRFCAVFGIPTDGGIDLETQEFEGATGECFVKAEEGDDGNMYSRLRLPKV